MQIGLTIRNSLLLWTAIGVGSLLAVASGALYTSHRLSGNQQTLVDVALQLESTAKSLNGDVARLLRRQTQLLTADSDADLDAVSGLAGIKADVDRLRGRLSVMGESISGLTPAVQRLDASYAKLLDTDEQLLARTREAVRLEQRQSQFDAELDERIRDLQVAAQGIAGRLRLKAKLQERRVKTLLARPASVEQLRDQVGELLLGDSADLQRLSTSIRLGSTELLATIRQVRNLQSGDALVSLRDNQFSQMLTATAANLEQLVSQLAADPVLGEQARVLRSDFHQLAGLVLDQDGGGDQTAFGLRQRQLALHDELTDLQVASASAGRELFAALTDIGAITRRVVDDTLAESAAQRGSSDGLVLVSSLVGIGLTLLLSVWIIRRVGSQLATTNQAMHAIAQGDGDLRARLAYAGHDEIGALARSFNLFVGKIHDLVRDVVDTSRQLTATADRLTGIADHTAESVQAQQSATDQVVDRVRQLDVSVRMEVESANNAAAAAESAMALATSGQDTVDHNVRAIERLNDQIVSATDTIEKLGTQSKSIGSILDVIQNIAEQTNLLALNAAIEAARAGEQGRGFSVVADEVRNLARRTQESTGEIHKLIGGLQSMASEAVDAMRAGRQGAEASVANAQQLTGVLQSIAESISTTLRMNVEIAEACSEQAASTSDIGRNIQRISEVAGAASNGAAQSRQAVEELMHSTRHLRGLVGRFKVEG